MSDVDQPQENSPVFNGPIAGSSLTQELGAHTSEQPPIHVDPSEAYQEVADRLVSKGAFKRLAVSAELGIPVELTTRAIVYSGWAEGYYTIDTMYLIYGPILELATTLLDEAGIDYIALANRNEDDDLESAMELLREARGDNITEDEVATEETEFEQLEEAPEEEQMPTGGLMGVPM